jgi:hypothetical protein
VLGGLSLGRGDTLRVSTEFDRVVRSGGYEAYISSWHAHRGRCWEGALVASHTLLEVEKVER